MTGVQTCALPISYALLARRFARPGRSPRQRAPAVAYLCGGNLVCWVAWQAASIAGILAGQALPGQWGLEFAGTLALLAVTCSLAAGSRLRAIAAIVAAGVALAAWALPYRLGIVPAIAAAVVAGLALEAFKQWSQSKNRPISKAGANKETAKETAP